MDRGRSLTPIQKHTSTRRIQFTIFQKKCLTPIQKHTSTRPKKLYKNLRYL